MTNGQPNGSKEKEPETKSGGYGFGAFKGVFTPSILTILGVIMYLRFGWVLGNVGLIETLIMVTLCCSITALTAISIAMMATNMKVGRGGAYYIISRSLGVEAGGAIGLPLFLAQALGISFYIAGFAESVCGLCPALSPQMVGIATLVVLTVLAYISADIALRTQYIVMALIFLSLGSFFLGGGGAPLQVPSPELVPDKLPFWAVFAVFFPAVTGIEAGLSMSGDLKNPARALPLGTIGAVLVSYLIYLAIPVFLSAAVPDRSILLTNSLIMRDVARWGNWVILGLWGAALSSAVGALLGAPRTLQALAHDGVVPRFLGRGFGRGNDPRTATLAAFLIGLAGILAGGLNVIGPVLSMFFLTSYGLLNLSAALEGLIGSPSWRPEFRAPGWLSLAGAVGCLAVAVLISPEATLLATVFLAGVYWLMRRRRLKAYWGDMRHGILMLLVRFALYRLADRNPNVRTWSPNILVLSGSPTSRWHLIALADAISHGKGFLTVAAVLPEEVSSADRADHLKNSIEEFLKKRRVPALVTTCSAPNMLEGAHQLVRTYGFGPITPNTILLGETEKERGVIEYVRLLQQIHRMRKNLVIVREADEPPSFGPEVRIDVWWSHSSHNAGFMLALAYLLQISPEWANARLVLKTIVDREEDREGASLGFAEFLRKGRVEAKVEALVCKDGNTFDMIRASSEGAGLVFIGLRAPKPDEPIEMYSRYYHTLMEHTEGFPSTAIVLAAEDIEFDRIFASPG